jgi:hypothetical protein
MDYFSAMATILLGLVMAIHRVFYIRPYSILSLASFTLAFAFFTAHVSYLSFFKFDYGYNMIAGVTIGVLQNFIWLGWSAANLVKRKYAWKIGVVVLLIFACIFCN